ncbi:MAG: MFS transporter, partial [Myxococcota bacterium]
MPALRGTILAVASFLAFGALLVLYGANASALIETLDLDYEQFGRVGSMLSLGLGLGIMSAGPLIDRLPRRPLFIAACALVFTATTTLGPDSTYGQLLVQTVAIGFGAGFYETVLNALIVEALGPRAPRRLVFVHAAATAAAAVTPLLFELIRSAAPLFWYDTFRLAGAAHAFLIVGALFVPMSAPAARAPIDTASRATGEAPTTRSDDRRTLAAVCLACFAYVGVEAAATLFVADHVTTGLGLGNERAARTISAFWGGLLVGRLAIG